ncbi:Ig-like domain-containing protein, partial [Nosocomiicoccus sp. HMSC09A07]|uniref:Ig-like domain-containing protein n=1 Tax=Nosocomiicoccus sp. HMSC09A07 TaxID=1581145 RepID=UPI0008A54A94
VDVTVTVEEPDVVVDKPTINQPNAGDKQVTGEGTPGNTVIVEFPDGSTGQAIVDNDGNWTVNVPKGVELKPGDIITAVQVDKDGNISEPVQIVVGAGLDNETDGNASAPESGKEVSRTESGVAKAAEIDAATTTNSEKVLPNTGEAQDNKGLVAGTAALFAGMGALVLGRRRKENEEK